KLLRDVGSGLSAPTCGHGTSAGEIAKSEKPRNFDQPRTPPAHFPVVNSEGEVGRVGPVDVDPGRTMEGVRAAGDRLQVPVAQKVQVEARPHLTALDEPQRQFVLRLAGDGGIPEEDLVNGAIGQVRADGPGDDVPMTQVVSCRPASRTARPMPTTST